MIESARKSDPHSLECLLSAYRNYLRLLARNYLDSAFRGKADPSDLVQETLLEAHQAFAEFHGDCEPQFAAWLRKILARNVTDFVRRFRTAARDIEREEMFDEGKLGVSLQTLSDTIQVAAGERIERRELGVMIADALVELPDEYREVIILRNLQNLSWEKIGQRMGRSAEAARKIWTRALVKFKPLVANRL